MKFVILALSVFSMPALACLGEAQIIATVTEVGRVNQSTCVAYINPLQVRYWMPNELCPLDSHEMASVGVMIGTFEGTQCNLMAGDELNGTVVREVSGNLVLH